MSLVSVNSGSGDEQLAHSLFFFFFFGFAVKWLGPGAVNPLLVDGKGGKAELIPAVRRWVTARGRSVTLPGRSHSLWRYQHAG
jgi:hypothetical protein